MSNLKETKEEEVNAPNEKSSPQHKDRVIRRLLKDPKRALEVCQAVTGEDYPEDAQVKLYDLENSILKRYNDVAVGIDDQVLFMIEHSSSISNNFPLRLFSYIHDVWFGWFVEVDQLYKEKQYKIPEPKFYVLYNGEKPLKQTKLKLSDAFQTSDGSDQKFALELEVTIIDVNHSSDNPVLKRSKSLGEYAYLVDRIRKGMRQGLNRDKAIRDAIAHCIEVNVLTDFLKTNYEEVAKMLVWEYNQEAEFKAIRTDGFEQGIE